MTREEAIKILMDGELNPCVDEDREACDMAIKALKQEPCEDSISRQAVINALCDGCELFKNGEQTCRSKCEEYHFLATLPPVNPQPKTGHWIDTGSGQECSECGEIQHGYDNFRFYCAKCGSKNVIES